MAEPTERPVHDDDAPAYAPTVVGHSGQTVDFLHGSEEVATVFMHESTTRFDTDLIAIDYWRTDRFLVIVLNDEEIITIQPGGVISD